MSIETILAELDSEIASLQQARTLLSSLTDDTSSTASPIRKRRKLSAASRKKIADGQRKRWAKQKAAK
jgi:hypothetical protein